MNINSASANTNNSANTASTAQTKATPLQKQSPSPEQNRSQETSFSKKELRALVDMLNNSPLVNIRFEFDQESETYFVNVIDTRTNDIIRKYPNEEAVQLTEKLNELMGVLFDTQA